MRLPFNGSFEAFAELVRRQAAKALESGQPQDDIHPFLVAQRKQDRFAIQIPIPPATMNSGPAKRAFGPEVLAPLIHAGADRLAIASMTWMVDEGTPAYNEVKRLDAAGQPIPAFDELGLAGVAEDLSVFAMEAQQRCVWTARVERTILASPQAPKWKLSTDAEFHWATAAQGAWAVDTGEDS